MTIQAQVIGAKRLNYGKCRAAAARLKGQLYGNRCAGDLYGLTPDTINRFCPTTCSLAPSTLTLARSALFLTYSQIVLPRY